MDIIGPLPSSQHTQHSFVRGSRLSFVVTAQESRGVFRIRIAGSLYTVKSASDLEVGARYRALVRSGGPRPAFQILSAEIPRQSVSSLGENTLSSLLSAARMREGLPGISPREGVLEERLRRVPRRLRPSYARLFAQLEAKGLDPRLEYADALMGFPPGDDDSAPRRDRRRKERPRDKQSLESEEDAGSRLKELASKRGDSCSHIVQLYNHLSSPRDLEGKHWIAIPVSIHAESPMSGVVRVRSDGKNVDRLVVDMTGASGRYIVEVPGGTSGKVRCALQSEGGEEGKELDRFADELSLLVGRMLNAELSKLTNSDKCDGFDVEAAEDIIRGLDAEA